MDKNTTLENLNQYTIEFNQDTCLETVIARIKKGPGKMAMQNILNYSKALMVQKTNTTGVINLLLN